MRTLKLHFPDEALPTLDTYLKQTKEARVFRRAQAVREVVKGQRLQTVSDALHFTYSALRKWVHRFAHQGVQGLADLCSAKKDAQFITICSPQKLAEELSISSLFQSPSRAKRRASSILPLSHVPQLRPTTNSDKLSDCVLPWT